MIVDTGVLLAAADRADPDHLACANLVEDSRTPLRTSPLIIAETAYLIGRQLGSPAEAQLFRSIAADEITVEAIASEDALRIADLVETYADLPLGAADASLVAIAERRRETAIATLDRRHFSVVRPSHAAAFKLLP